jgi:hypothetical protein
LLVWDHISPYIFHNTWTHCSITPSSKRTFHTRVECILHALYADVWNLNIPKYCVLTYIYTNS